ncbi:zinc knuckle CX2CX4HX4C containing protein, partial [Tanacetum coccineum]
MADHSQKWRDGTTSKNIGSSSSNDGLTTLVNKLDNLGRNIKKLKESVHEIQVGCQICEGPYLDKDCPLNKEVKQVEETDNRPPYGERRQSLEEMLAKHQEESAQRSTEMEIEQLTEELCSRNEKSEQAKIVIVEHKGPSSPKKLKNLHRISFLSDSQEENTNDQLPTKESNPGHFTLPCTIRNFNFYSMADLGASVNVLPRNIFEYLGITNHSETRCKFTKALDVDKDPLERCLDEYNWVFHKEIEKLADEYEIKIEEKGQVLKKYGQNVKELDVRIKIGGTMAGVDVDTLTMEQYLALSRENQAPGVVKPEIRGNVNFEIKSQFMRELREDTFSGNKDEDAHDHIDRVLSIVGLFNI